MHDEHFVVRILHTSCCRLIQPLKMYVIWYMMWYLEKDMFCKEHIFSDWCIIFRTVCPSSVSVGLAVVRHPSDTFHVELVCASVHIFVCVLIFTIACRIVFSNRVHDCMNNLFVGPGFEPLALHTIFFVGPGFDSLTLQHDLFVGPGFDSWTRSPVSVP